MQPVQAVDWAEGTPAPYLVVARAFAGMEGTTKRLLKDEVLGELFRAVLARCPGAQAPRCPVLVPAPLSMLRGTCSVALDHQGAAAMALFASLALALHLSSHPADPFSTGLGEIKEGHGSLAASRMRPAPDALPRELVLLMLQRTAVACRRLCDWTRHHCSNGGAQNMETARQRMPARTSAACADAHVAHVQRT